MQTIINNEGKKVTVDAGTYAELQSAKSEGFAFVNIIDGSGSYHMIDLWAQSL